MLTFEGPFVPLACQRSLWMPPNESSRFDINSKILSSWLFCQTLLKQILERLTCLYSNLSKKLVNSGTPGTFLGSFVSHKKLDKKCPHVCTGKSITTLIQVQLFGPWFRNCKSKLTWLWWNVTYTNTIYTHTNKV